MSVIRFSFGSLLALGLAVPALAVAPKLNSTSPPGWQRGQEIEIKLQGERLDDAEEVLFYSPGFKVLHLETPKPTTVLATVRIADDCALGEHLVRVRTRGGVSELRTFYVSALTNLTEVEPNNEAAKAQKVPLNCTINGTVGQDDVDFFQVEVKKGERLSAEVEAMRLGKTALDPFLAIYDSDHHLLASCDDLALTRQDSALSIQAPRDGTYFIEVRETSYSGQANSDYRLHLGTFPRPTAVFPLGGRVHEKLKVQFLGDASGPLDQEIQLPANPSDQFAIFAADRQQFAPSPNWLRVVDMPNVLKSEPNHSREEATATTTPLPCAFNGIISTTNESDWFRFPARKGVAVEATVYARRLRSRLDSVIEVFDAKGRSLAQNDDAGSADSSLKFTPNEDGDYFIRITDQLGRGGFDYPYRIEVGPATPSLAVSIPQIARNDSQGRQFIVVPRGNRVATLLSVKRGNAAGPLELDLPGLPAGVDMHGTRFASKQDAMPVVFEAAADAPLSARLLNLRAITTNGLRGSFAQNIEFIYGQNNNVYYGSRAEKFLVAVAEEAPFKINITPPRVPLVQSGAMNLLVEVERTNGFDEPITLRMVWNPPGISTQPEITIPKGSNSVLYPLNANGGAEIAEWDIALMASATVRGGTLWVSSPLTRLKLEPPWVSGRFEPATAEPGQKTRLVCKLETREAFEGNASFHLVGLPDNIKAEDKTAKAGDTEIVFDLSIDPNCPTKTIRNLACSVSIPKSGETIPHTIASGGTLRVIPAKKSKPAPAVAAVVEKN